MNNATIYKPLLEILSLGFDECNSQLANFQHLEKVLLPSRFSLTWVQNPIKSFRLQLVWLDDNLIHRNLSLMCIDKVCIRK